MKPNFKEVEGHVQPNKSSTRPAVPYDVIPFPTGEISYTDAAKIIFPVMGEKRLLFMRGRTQPRWLTYQAAKNYCGISNRTHQNYENAGLITAANVIQPGHRWGRKLLDRYSLDVFIEAGVGRPPTELAMNLNRNTSHS